MPACAGMQELLRYIAHTTLKDETMFGFHRHHPDRAAWAGHCGGRSRHPAGEGYFEEYGMFGHRGGRHGEGLMRGGARTALFAQGDLRLVVLALLQERPRHGYEVIKAIEE